MLDKTPTVEYIISLPYYVDPLKAAIAVRDFDIDMYSYSMVDDAWDYIYNWYMVLEPIYLDNVYVNREYQYTKRFYYDPRRLKEERKGEIPLDNKTFGEGFV